MPTATESDDELLASLEPGSLAVFYRRHVEDLVAFFMRRTRNAELAADLTAETFAAALVARARFEPGRGGGSAWLYGIALHKLHTSSAARRPSGVHAGGWAWSRSTHRRRHRAHRRAGIGPRGHTCCWSGSARGELAAG